MPKFLTKIAVNISEFFLRTEYTAIVESLDLLRESVLSYDSKLNPNLSLAVQAAEDRKFFNHSGFHVRAMARALYVYVTRRQLQGASTIEQQLVRVMRNRFEVSISRKVSEIILATAVSGRYPKNTILEMYLEVAYFGWRGSGIRQICERLDLELISLSIANACKVAALIKAPMPKLPSKSYNERLDRRIRYIKLHINLENRRLQN